MKTLLNQSLPILIIYADEAIFVENNVHFTPNNDLHHLRVSFVFATDISNRFSRATFIPNFKSISTREQYVIIDFVDFHYRL